MAKFKTVDEVKKAFLLRSNGSERLGLHQTRFSDLSKYAPIVERLLDTDYNKINGYSFSELMECVSSISENYSSSDYVRAINNDKMAVKLDESLGREIAGEDNFWSVCESLNTATTAQAPYPVPSINLTTWQYEKAVIPYLAHQFDLKGNRGLVYYQKVTAGNAKGNIAKDDLLGSPRELGKQPIGFAGTKVVDKEEIATMASGTATYQHTLAMHPVQAGSLVINVEGATGHFKDFAQEGAPEEVALYSIGGNLGTATVNLTTGVVDITLATAPSTSGGKIFATYRADIETEAGTGNIAEAQVSLESVTLEAEDFSIKTDTSIYQEALSKAIFGLDWNSQVDDALAALYNKEIANKIVSEIKAEIPAASITTHSMNKISGGNNDLFNVQFLAVVMGKLGQMITKASGLNVGKLAAMVINIDVLPLIRALSKFKPANVDEENVMGGMYLVGLYEGIPVLVGYEPVVASGEVIGLYKSSKKDFLAPYAWGTFILPIVRDIFDTNNLALNKKQLISSAAGKVVCPNLASKITLTDIDNILG